VTTVRLGLLRSEDRARVAELLVATRAFSREEVSVALELFDTSHPERGEGAASPADPDYEFRGAYDEDGLLLGYACFGATPETEGTYDLYWLAVHPDAQGRGVGRALVDRVEQELASRGARLLVVETSSRPDYAHTRTFYAREGYAEVARVRDFYAPADDRIILTTRLTPREGGVATR
jgi:GNAT superfamily N-acetyltransferase